MKNHYSLLISVSCLILFRVGLAQPNGMEQYNMVWDSPSENASQSMPCGGGDIGLNVWSENGEILFYLAKCGTFDENNTLLKLGRIRLTLKPNPFDGGLFRQELHLKDGYVSLKGTKDGLTATVRLWVDVYHPVVHVEVEANQKINANVTYENWRYRNRLLRKLENFQNSYKWMNPEGLMTAADQILFSDGGVLFLHQNDAKTVFDITVEQQGLESIKSNLYNPIGGLTFGGFVAGDNMVPADTHYGKYLDTDFQGWVLQSKRPSRSHEVEIFLHTADSRVDFEKGLEQLREIAHENRRTAFDKSRTWWNEFWNRSFVVIQPNEGGETDSVWQVGRNYQLFRYMLGCNAYGDYPTKFNGGLFTVDPVFTDSTRAFTPDFRNWGGGTFTAQNQRLVYFPMLKGGDFDMMNSQFDFYRRILKNAELRSQFYWGHNGACYTEQIENFGLPNCSEYSWDRPEDYPKGRQYNAWLEYQYDTSLEFCYMILQTAKYNGNDISGYLPMIKSCLRFFDEHYQYLANQRGRKTLDENGHLVLYPGSSCETYKMAYNSTTTIAALKTVLSELMTLPEKYVDQVDKEYWKTMSDRIPPISLTQHEGHQTIAPAKLWERVNNTEVPQLYPVYPWGMYGIGRPDLDIAVNTWKYDPDALKFRSHVGWKQDVIFAARMGLTDEAAELCVAKMKNSDRRFPAFWGPGFDWVPDHNWGGSGMIGVQEMLMQTVGDKIYLFPAWPKDWDVHFKLHAPGKTTVEVALKNGAIQSLNVLPESRAKDIINCYETNK